ncbi:MAG: AAA family ATPase [Nanoarchaeota archaeon]
MAKTITFAHFKGGTGKTTSCINVAGFLAKQGKKVLVVDIDPQGNLTSGLGIDKNSLKYNMYHVMNKEIDIKNSILKTQTENVHLVPSNADLLGANLRAYKSKNDAKILKNALSSVNKFYDYILIDTPPSNWHFIVNGVVAAHSVVLCLDPGIFALEGVDTFNNVFRSYCKKIGVDLNISMALLTKTQNSFLPFLKNTSAEIKKGAKDYVVKPFEEAKLAETVKKVLG